MSTLSDRQLVAQAQIGQSEALGQLFDRYGAGVFDFLARVVGDPDEAVHLVSRRVFASPASPGWNSGARVDPRRIILPGTRDGVVLHSQTRLARGAPTAKRIGRRGVRSGE